MLAQLSRSPDPAPRVDERNTLALEPETVLQVADADHAAAGVPERAEGVERRQPKSPVEVERGHDIIL